MGKSDYRRCRACWLGALVVALVAGIAHGQGPRAAMTDQQYIDDLSGGLDSLRAELQDKPLHPLLFSVNLFYAHGGVVKRFPAEVLLKCVDAFHEAGARRVDINLAIDPWRNGDAETIKKYDAVVARIRELGMTLAINPEVNHRHDPSETFDTWKAAALKVYPEIAHRYRPEMFAVIHEPTTMTSRLMPRIVPRETKDYVQAVTEAIGPQKWAEFAAAAVGRIKAASPKTRCAAGVLYYERPFLREFLTIKRLDAISLDIYGLSRLRTYDQMIEAARRAGKTVYIEESWRETYTDPMWAKFKNITPRPGGDAVFELIDSKWLETIAQYASARGLEAVTACGVTCMQTLFYYSTDGHGGNLDPVYMRHVVEAVNGGQRTKTFETLKRLTARYSTNSSRAAANAP